MSPGDDGTTTSSRPAVPQALRRELEKELAAARALLPSDPDAARPRVHDAEVALGGHEEEPSPEGRRARLAATMRALLRNRRPEATICPSDAARTIGGESWRDLMDLAREVVAELSEAGVIVVRQHGDDVDLATAVGPVRLARGPRWENARPS